MATNKKIEKSESVDTIMYEEKRQLSEDLCELSTSELKHVEKIIKINEPEYDTKLFEISDLKLSTLREVQNHIRVLRIIKESVTSNSNNQTKKTIDEKIVDVADRLYQIRKTMFRVSEKTLSKKKYKYSEDDDDSSSSSDTSSDTSSSYASSSNTSSSDDGAVRFD
ncbi:hypothetical protein HCN44_005397 [Aphidius gifuensis]|uniref:NET domain-containing protein n=1 Tax=Aphidius gifuensis TaxID=684658 RepID=A0A834Y313_APHGI|nr:uncharacterized protein LOC122854971 [Aphidius gifuensis]KAF7997120.1 hypothetical protein HCN44_005397 [Aphidius gifuensis]